MGFVRPSFRALHPLLTSGKKRDVSCAVRLQGELVGTFLGRDPKALP